MIDQVWFEHVAGFAGVDLADRAPSKLCAELGETYEVLPYLIACNGFSDWPLTREALRLAAKNATRASRARPVVPKAAPSGHLRTDVRQRMEVLLDSNSVHEKPGPTQRAIVDAELLTSSVKRVRVKSDNLGRGPEVFISDS